MARHTLIRLMLAASAAIATGVLTGTASAATPPAVLTFGRLAGIGLPLHCTTASKMRELSGDTSASRYVTEGFTRAGEVWLQNWVCDGLVHFAQTTLPQNIRLMGIEAVEVLFHEAAHVHGTHDEQAAECAGVRGALAKVRGSFPEYLGVVQKQLLVTDEKYRPAAYKLRGTCLPLTTIEAEYR
jgi:hypothetical protein